MSTSKSDHKRRKTKNKKRRRDSSLSSYSDYQSVSSDSDLSSTDDNDIKIRKARRSRVSLKDIKGKGRKRSTSSIGDIDATSGRKRKRIGRDHDIRPIKKPSKKKPKKDLSSSSSSDSGSSSSSADDKRQRKRVVSDKEKGREKGRGSRKGRHKHKDRSPSYTSLGRDSNPGFTVGNCDEEFFPVDYSRRLRSVITVVDQPRNDEDNRWEKDPHKEEIVYDQNDYPSPKSLDSNEGGGTKMDSDNQFNVAVSDRICIENTDGEEVSELGKSRIDEGDHNNGGDRQSEDLINYSEKEKEIDKSVPDAALGGDALESILRQKALENLRKFRERPQASPRSNMVKTNNVARLSDETVDTIQNESIEQGSTDAQEINKRSGLLLQRETAEVVKLPNSEHVEKKPVLAKQNITHPNNGAALLQCSEEDRSACSEAVAAEAVSGSNTSPGARGTKACSSSNVEPTSGEHSSEQGNEAKDGSQFEQKTMTVMRGGELVQVITFL